MNWRNFTKERKPDGPEIFSGFWRAKDQLRKEIVLAKNYTNRVIRMAYILDYVPWSWRDIVCICDHSLIGFKADKIHKTCGKYSRWLFFRKCLGCENPFVQDNNHPKKSGLYCYDCLVKKYGTMNSENFFNKVPRELSKLEDREVFDSPAFPSFDF